MQEIKAEISPNECTHPEIVKLYHLGAHDGYGCIKCKHTASEKEEFK